GDLVHRAAGDQLLQRPHQVRQIDPVHRGAVAHGTVQEHDLLVGVGVRQPTYEVQLGAHRPGRSGRGVRDGLDDLLSGAAVVGRGDHLVPALRVDQDAHAGYPLAYLGHTVQGEPAVHRAVTAPQDHAGVAQLRVGEPAPGLVRVVEHAVGQVEAQLPHGG